MQTLLPHALHTALAQAEELVPRLQISCSEYELANYFPSNVVYRLLMSRHIIFSLYFFLEQTCHLFGPSSFLATTFSSESAATGQGKGIKE